MAGNLVQVPKTEKCSQLFLKTVEVATFYCHIWPFTRFFWRWFPGFLVQTLYEIFPLLELVPVRTSPALLYQQSEQQFKVWQKLLPFRVCSGVEQSPKRNEENRVSSDVADFSTRNQFLTTKLLKQFIGITNSGKRFQNYIDVTMYQNLIRNLNLFLKKAYRNLNFMAT